MCNGGDENGVDPGAWSDRPTLGFTLTREQRYHLPHKKRRAAPEYHRHSYQEYHLVECLINRSWHHRRVLSRFDTPARRFLGALTLAAAPTLLRWNVNTG